MNNLHRDPLMDFDIERAYLRERYHRHAIETEGNAIAGIFWASLITLVAGCAAWAFISLFR